eukprot:TRINITY_DN81410_c0_g1_i1.p1 TRINITY_DN81410_c0_g1~~TRINITY_DN81410_c0_g1_i1.p1  ORF type:complete len:483 (-),score=28.38 TRINITY_DN81410_c0_g1_i1:17-1465(-)
MTVSTCLPHEKHGLFLVVCVLGSLTIGGLSVVSGNGNFKSDWCRQLHAVLNGSTELRDVLAGRHLSVGTGIWADLYLSQDSETGRLIGLETDILDELAKRGSFTYEFVLHDWASSGESWAEKETVAIDTYDMVTYGYWFIIPERGPRSPYGFLDMSTVLVAIPGKQEAQEWSVMLLKFAEPFTGDVWAMVVVTIIATGLVFWLLEAGRNTMDFPQSSPCSISSTALAITKSSLHLTGGGNGFAPKTWPGRLLLVSWSWCIILLLSAYTANLASSLVAKAEMKADVSSLRQAVQHQKTICAAKGTNLMWLQREYPDAVTHEVSSVVEAAKSLVSRRCDAAVMGVAELEELRHTKGLDERCALEIVGQRLVPRMAGFLVQNDYNHTCSILVRDALAIHFIAMEADGTLEKIYRDALQRQSACPDVEDSGSPTTSNRMDMSAMGGVFCLHALGSMLALSMFFVTKLHSKEKPCPPWPRPRKEVSL